MFRKHCPQTVLRLSSDCPQTVLRLSIAAAPLLSLCLKHLVLAPVSLRWGLYRRGCWLDLEPVAKRFTAAFGCRRRDKDFQNQSCAPLWHFPPEVRRDESQVGPRLSSLSPRSRVLSPPLSWENPRNGKPSRHISFHLYSWRFNEAAQVKIQAKCWMYYSSVGPWETWTNDPLLISCSILLLMDTVEVPEMLLQPHIPGIVICLVFLSAAEHFVFERVHLPGEWIGIDF